MDNLINSITSTSDSGITLTLPMTIVAMAAALIFGLVISLTYMGTHKNKYQQSFAITLTMLPIILTVIILFVGSNVARAFSLAGTLSIIRFRSAPGDPEDIGYIFFDIAAGLACGVGLYGYGAIFVVLLCAIIIVTEKCGLFRKKSIHKILKITIPEDLNYQGAFDDILRKYTKKYALLKIKTTDLGSLFELCYSVTTEQNQNEQEFLNELRCRNGNLNIILSVSPENVM